MCYPQNLTNCSEPSFLIHFSSTPNKADPTKAVITLQPPWVNVFQMEKVTLWCEGHRLPGDNSTQWLVNGTVSSVLTPSYSIAAASFSDTGEYRCQTSLSTASDPVQLEIHKGKYSMEQEGWKSWGLPVCLLLSGCHTCLCWFIWMWVSALCVCQVKLSQDTQNITLESSNCAPKAPQMELLWIGYLE